MCRLFFTVFVLVIFASPALSVPAPNSRDTIARLIADLDSDNFRTREAATKELLRIGIDALPALKDAMAKSPSEEAARRIKSILQTINPVYEGHSSGWHWVFQDLAHSQTFKSTGGGIESVKLRVARMNDGKPGDDLTVEIRDPSLGKIYFRGTITAEASTREFRWHTVKTAHKAELKEGEQYLLIFHSRGTVNTAPWAVNAIYQDIYPHGQHGVHAHEDFFFEIQFTNRRTLRVGPDGENTKMKTPINSGNGGGTAQLYGEQRLADGKKLPDGEAVGTERK
jgi:hypothetical protein